MSKRWAAIAAVMIGILAACGGGGGDANGDQVASLDGSTPQDSTPDTASDAPTDPEEAALAFTKCMRDHGVDLPDPQVTRSATGSKTGGGPIIATNVDPEDPAFAKAQEACEPLMANVRGELDNDPERQAEMKQQLLAFAKCMRDHGIDMPDPTFDANGNAQITGGPPPADRDSKAFDDASKACAPDGMTFATKGGGPAGADSKAG
jgi:hypothetical protein